MSKRNAGLAFQMRKITPRTAAQHDVFAAWSEGFNLVLDGCAGTGKTFLAFYLALKTGLPVRIIRSAVASREIGHLPGNAKEKMAVYEQPYVSIAAELYGRADAYSILKQKNMVSFESTSFLRGTTMDAQVVILDEAENCTFHELDTVLTRIGENSRIILCGDEQQNDLIKSKYDQSGWQRFKTILDRMEEFDFVDFDVEDIVRSGLVRSYIIAKRN